MNFEAIKEKAIYQKKYWEEMDGRITEVDLKDNVVRIGDVELFLSPVAKTQVLERLKIPGTVREWSKDLDFLQIAVDKRIKRLTESKHSSPERIIFDMKSREAKAVRTTKYKRLFNADLMAVVEKKYGTDLDERFSYIDDERMIVAYKEMKTENTNVGDTVGFSVQIRNSEAGIMRLSAAQYWLRKICTNGAVAPIKEVDVEMYHVYDDIYDRLMVMTDQMLETSEVMALINRAEVRPALTTVDRLSEMLTKYGVQKIYHEPILLALKQESIGVSADGINGYAIHNAITRYVSHDFLGQENANANLWAAQQLMTQAYQFLRV